VTTPTPLPADRILVITAHPDDVDFSSAGSIAGWTAAGATVGYCICTDGDAGGEDPDVPREKIGAVRREEQRAAGAIVGVSDIEFLGHRDGELMPTLELRRDISRAIRRFRPDRVITSTPLRDLRSMYGSHPDHMAVGEATLCAIYPDARNPMAFPELLREEGLAAHAVAQTWVMSSNDRADHYVDITATFDRKLAALLAHVSQTGGRDGFEERMRQWGALQARAGGLPEGSLAEGFLILETA
jgi:LmbE family N-acetylglucosaminyl deacetylase